MSEPTPNACCSTKAQATCCEPSDKAACCGEASSGSCGCAAGQDANPGQTGDIRETVRGRYALAARAAGIESGCGCGSDCDGLVKDPEGEKVFGGALYIDRSDALTDTGTAAAIKASLGCGVPTAAADLHDGEVVLDLGSGAGADVLISARRVAPTGRAIGLDMTDEMLALARANAREAGVENVEFVKGYLEATPLPDASVDVIISNCVINLSGDKLRTIAEAARVLKPGGRFAISDVIADPDMDEQTRADTRRLDRVHRRRADRPRVPQHPRRGGI